MGKQTPPPGMFKAGQLAALCGITRQALHQYVLLGILLPEAASTGGQRWYNLKAVDRITLIHALQRSGSTLASIRDQLEGLPQS